ncbi:MAG: alpha/beta hydrolase, partial [Candidatus Omnitrophica bacterium]|nr:alpha/beta hydrolase [Candidatus Omnitrophota bacterium]
MKQKSVLKLLAIMFFLILGIGFSSVFAQSNAQQNVEVIRTATSADGTAINYYEHGQKGPVLVFVHGWSCDASYWKEQVEYFKHKYHMVLTDLAGHGRSGSERENYTIEAYGQDVKAVVESIGAEKVILIGHSMGALVIAHAARLMPEKVIGLIAVDDLQNVEYPL